MNLSSLTTVGRVLKSHGVHGELSIEYFVDVFNTEKIEDIPFLFFKLDGLFVPFQIAKIRNKSSPTAYIQLTGINSEDKAAAFGGLEIYAQKEKINIEKNDEFSLNFFINFQLHDSAKKNIGSITEIDNSTENILFVVVDNQGKEILIPATEEHILHIDTKNKLIVMDLPKGLLDL